VPGGWLIVVNLALTDLAAFIETTQLAVPVQAPLHPSKTLPLAAEALRVTVAPGE